VIRITCGSAEFVLRGRVLTAKYGWTAWYFGIRVLQFDWRGGLDLNFILKRDRIEIDINGRVEDIPKPGKHEKGHVPVGEDWMSARG
jgi:hypothetical protein